MLRQAADFAIGALCAVIVIIGLATTVVVLAGTRPLR